MKNIIRIFVALCAVVAAMPAMAQDIIITVEGDSIEAKVIKIAPPKVEYKKWSNQDGPVYETPVSGIAVIRFANGDSEVFNAVRKTVKAKETEATSVNDSLMEVYNRAPFSFKSRKMKNKPAGSAIGVLAIAPGSVMAGEDLTVTLKQVKDGIITLAEPGNVQNLYDINFDGRYVICLTNNTESDIYIDKSASFRTDHGAAPKAYADTAAVGSDRFILIPPHCTAPLSVDSAAVIKGQNKILVYSKSEYFDDFPQALTDSLRDGEIRQGDPSSGVRAYSIKYTSDPAADTAKHQDFSVYVRECMGFRYSNDTNLSPYNGEWKDLFRRRYTSFGMKYDDFAAKYLKEKSPDAIVVIDGWIEQKN